MKSKKKVASLFTLILLLAYQAFAASGSISLDFRGTAYVGGAKIDQGKCQVTWNADASEAEVTFSQNGKQLVTVPAKLIELDTKSNYNCYLVEKDGSGNEIIKEIHFQGKKSILQFE